MWRSYGCKKSGSKDPPSPPLRMQVIESGVKEVSVVSGGRLCKPLPIPASNNLYSQVEVGHETLTSYPALSCFRICQ